MRRSGNEIESVLRKACLGAGLEIGRADELARAALWLEERGERGMSDLVEGLVALPSERLIAVKTSSGYELPAVFAVPDGPSAIDLALAGRADKVVNLKAIDRPNLLFGLAGVAAAAHAVTFFFKFENGVETEISAFALRQASAAELPSGPVTMRCETIVGKPHQSPEKPNGIEVEATLWNRAESLAALTYVTSTEASRHKGAGAGVIDRD